MPDEPVVTEGDVTPPEGDVTPPAEPVVEPTPEPTIPVSLLPRDLQGLPDSEVQAYLNAMVDSTTRGADRIRALEDQVLALREKGIPDHAREIPPDDLPPLEEQVLDDARGAIRRVVLEEFGPEIDALRTDSSMGSREALLSRAAREIPDFATHEENVRAIVEKHKEVTSSSIRGAYLMSEGMAAVDRRKKAAAAAAAEPPSPPKTPTPADDVPQLTRDIAANMGVTAEELPGLLEEGPYEVEVPTNM